MKVLELNQMGTVYGGDGFEDLAGGLACGFMVGALIFGGLAIIAAAGCINYLRKLE